MIVKPLGETAFRGCKMKEQDKVKKEVISVIRDLLVGSKQIKKVIAGIDEARFSDKPKDGRWSIQELLCRLCNAEIVFAYQVKKILSEDDPTLLGFDSDRWAKRLDYRSEDTRMALMLYQFLRIHILKILRTRPIEDFHRHGIHGEKGVLSLLDLLHERAQQDRQAIDDMGEKV